MFGNHVNKFADWPHFAIGKVIGGMLLISAIFKSAKDAINALKSDIHVQCMVTSAKLQMQGIISQSDALAGLAGKISNILKSVEGSFTAEAMAYLEQYLTAEKGSRFLEVVRKLEKELGDKKTQLDTAKAKRIVECLDDGMSVDDVVRELKEWCEVSDILNGEAHNVVNYAKYKEILSTTEKANPLIDSLRNTGELPSNYITKAEAIEKGWKPGKALNNYVSDAQIGGDIFKNSEGILPESSGRIWYEADIGISNTVSRAKQAGTRLLYSNDGFMYITYDHYKTFYPIGTWK